MRLLVIHDELYPNTSANARIVYRIIDELLKHDDVEVTIMGCAQTKDQFGTHYHKCPIIHVPWQKTCWYFRFIDQLGRFKILRYILMPRSIVYRILHPRWTPRDVEMMRWIYHHRRQFDVVLACAMPFYSIDIAAQISKYIPVVNYYMEPYWEHLPSFYSNTQIISRLWDGLASRVIVPEHIKQIYKKYADKDIVDKLVVAEFPNVLKRDENKIDYIFSVTNVGTVVARSVELVDRIPDGILIKTAVNTFYNSTVFHGNHFNTELTAHFSYPQASFSHRTFKSDNRNGSESCNMDNGADGVGAVEGGVKLITPMIPLAVGDLGPDGFCHRK